MKKLLTMGFLKSEKSGEKRIALLPENLCRIKHCNQLYFETGYASDFQIEDEQYVAAGCHVVSKKELLTKDILCDPKIGEATYLKELTSPKVLFGWIHAGGDQALTSLLVKQKDICYAWEDMYEEQRHIFWKNNWLAGAGGVLNGLQYTGWLPYGKKAAILGRGDVAMGAYHMLCNLGADCCVYNRKQEALFQKEVADMDIIVMAIRYDTTRKQHILTDDLLKHMKKSAIIIDVSADVNGAIEHSITTSIEHATYYLFDTLVYSVNNVPSIFYKTATTEMSKVLAPYIDILIEQEENEVLKASKIIENGTILDQRIIEKQK